MTDRVVDASALIYALLGETPAATDLRKKLRDNDCHAPHLIDAEIGNVLRGRVRSGALSAAAALTALRAARDVVDVRYSHAGALAELAWIWRDNLTFYDALYVALAVRLDIPLWTGDRRLSRARGLPCAVELA